MPATPAFVLKNYMPHQHKVAILHKQLGKISCKYATNDQAASLCTGSQLLCLVDKKRSWFAFNVIDIIQIPTHCSIEDIQFLHKIMHLCITLLPYEVQVAELFDFLWYVLKNVSTLTPAGKQIVLLRLFLMFDLLPENKNLYQIAFRDPYQKQLQNSPELDTLIQTYWNTWYQSTK